MFLAVPWFLVARRVERVPLRTNDLQPKNMKFELGEKKGKGGKTRLTDKCADIRLNDNKNRNTLF